MPEETESRARRWTRDDRRARAVREGGVVVIEAATE
jgi:hypothetical protein